jgi:uncharacterized repeat protein (TIGR01451 family)
MIRFVRRTTMRKQISKRILALAALAILAMCATAFAGPLESLMETLLVTKDAAGAEVLKKTDAAYPGDIVEYRTTYRNAGDSALSGLVVQIPVPPNTTYVAGSAASLVVHDLLISIDGGATWDEEPVKRMRQGEDGEKKEIIIGPEEYTHIRWVPKRAIQPGEVQVFRCRVKIS